MRREKNDTKISYSETLKKNEEISSTKPQERQDTMAIHQYLWDKTLCQKR